MNKHIISLFVLTAFTLSSCGETSTTQNTSTTTTSSIVTEAPSISTISQSDNSSISQNEVSSDLSFNDKYGYLPEWKELRDKYHLYNKENQKKICGKMFIMTDVMFKYAFRSNIYKNTETNVYETHVYIKYTNENDSSYIPLTYNVDKFPEIRSTTYQNYRESIAPPENTPFKKLDNISRVVIKVEQVYDLDMYDYVLVDYDKTN